MQDNYTNNEICTIYRNQVDRTEGVKILCQLTGWSKAKIEGILEAGGYTDYKRTRKKNPNGPTSRIIDEVALELYNKGYSDTTIAAEFNLKTDSVSRWRKLRGLESNRDKQLREKDRRIEEGRAKNLSISKVAQYAGVHLDTVYKYYRKRGYLNENSK